MGLCWTGDKVFVFFSDIHHLQEEIEEILVEVNVLLLSFFLVPTSLLAHGQHFTYTTCPKCFRFDLQKACTLNECEIEIV